jgi:hypothetical protein
MEGKQEKATQEDQENGRSGKKWQTTPLKEMSLTK